MAISPRGRAASGAAAALSPPVAATAVLAACVAGALVSVAGVIGIAGILALAYAPIVLVSVPVAICLWVPVNFFEGMPGAINAPEVGFLLLLGGWLALLRPGSRVAAVLRAQRNVILVLALFVAWALATLLWAQDPARGLNLMPSYVEVALLFVILMSSLAAVRHIGLFALCFVLGVAASVGIGLAGGESALGGAFYEAGRLRGGLSDPNFLAVGIVTAIALAAGVAPSMRTLLGRWMLGLTVVLLLIGLGATQSRGGLVAACAAAVAALWVARGRRRRAFGFICLALAVAAVWFATNPAALERVTTQDRYGGSGRTDLWRLAWREFEDHPIQGVGLENFAIAAQPYLREPGGLNAVQHVERGQETHNLYLGLLAETGLVGLLLYLTIPLASIRAAMMAGRRFESLGDYAAVALARAVVVACIAALAGAFFIPGAVDKRIWVLFALGPALLAASTMPPTPTRPDGRRLAPGAMPVRRP